MLISNYFQNACGVHYHRKAIRTFIALFILLFPVISAEEIDKIQFTHLNTKDGLSQGAVSSILQDYKGFMWFGTLEGLNRYDGKRFTVYRYDSENPYSISGNTIWGLYEDRERVLWIGTEGYGLNRFDQKTGQFYHYRHDPKNSKSLSHDSVFAIYQDRHGTLWTGTYGGGLNRLDRDKREKGEFTAYKANSAEPGSISSNYIYSIIEDHAGTIWVGTNNGLNRFDPKTGTFSKYFKNSGVPALFMDKTKNLWVGTDNKGLFCLRPGQNDFQPANMDPGKSMSHYITAINEGNAGTLWIGSYGGGLLGWNRESNRLVQYKKKTGDPGSLPNNAVRTIYKDRCNVLWIGTWMGVSRFDMEQKNFVHYKNFSDKPDNSAGDDVYAIYEDRQGILWIGTDGAGLTAFDRNKNRFTHYVYDKSKPHGINDTSVLCIYEDRDGIFWLGTYMGGLNRFDRSTNRFTYYTHDPDNPTSICSNFVRCIREDADGYLWIGTSGDGGLNRFDPKSGQFTRYLFDPQKPNGLADNVVLDVKEDHARRLWIGMWDGGLDLYDRASNRFIHHLKNRDNPAAISSNRVYCIMEDKKNRLWIGTNAGINLFNPEKNTFLNYREKDGLCNDVVIGILEDLDGNLWLSTSKGISRFNPGTLTFRNYYVPDGLQGEEFNIGSYYISQKEELFFGGMNGFNSFFPDLIYDNPFLPQVGIVGFYTFEHVSPIGTAQPNLLITDLHYETNTIKLSYKERMFSIEFAAFHYADPDRNQYQFILQGYNKRWIKNGNRNFATFTRMEPGSYTFRVKASNNDGIWNEKDASLNIVVLPPFWQQWWFIAFSFLLLFSMVYWVSRLRVRHMHKREEELENIIAQRTHQLVQANNELEKLSIAARETDNAVIIMDAEGNLEWVNDGFKRIYGATLETMISHRGPNLLKASFNPDIHNIFKTCSETKKSIIYEVEMVSVLGEKKWLQSTLTPVLDPGKNIKKMVVIDSDITRLKRSEEELIKKSRELEKAREIAIHEQEVAEIANRSKGEFLARMSHEIRTPMNGVIGFAEMLLNTDLTDEQADYARTINQSAEILITLLNDILDFSKIDAGELALDPIDFDPEITIFDICELILPKIAGKNIEVLCRIGDNIPAYVKADPGRFRQVVMNLMGNAAKFTEQGEIEVSLDMIEEDDENKRLKLLVKVRDTGIGIPEDKQKSIFDVFQQADGSITRMYGGTGLGLAICRQISKLMGGDVWVDSQPRTGSTFYFSAWVDVSSKIPEPEPRHEWIAGKKIIIMDDNSNNLDILGRLLAQAQIRVVPLLTSQCEDIVSHIRSSFEQNDPFDICIIDTHLPGHPGFETAQKIRELPPPMSNIPLLAVSSLFKGYPSKCFESLFNGFLPKPIRRKKLLKMLTRLLREKVDGEPKEGQPKKEIITQHSIIEDSKHSVRILLVEDNPINQKLSQFILNKAGYQLTTAENGQEAVDLYTSYPDRFDLVFMDIQMPVMDGNTAARVIRSKGFTDIPIIAMTAGTMKGDREKCLEAGMNDYISKPIKREKVFEMVKKWYFDKT